MGLSISARDMVFGDDVGSFLRLLSRSLGLGPVILASPGKALVVGGPGASGVDDKEVPRLFQVAAALRQRLAIADLSQCPAYRETRLLGSAQPLRFFMSVPLIAASGDSLGALCVVDARPHGLDGAAAVELAEQLEEGARVAVSLLLPCDGGATALTQLGFNLAQAEGSALARAAAERRYRKMYDRASALARIGAWECDLATHRLTWTDGVYDIFGLQRGSHITQEMVLPLFDHVSRRDMERLRLRAIETGAGFSLDVHVRDVRGTLKWVRVSAEVEMEAGVAARIFGLKQDITAERELLDQVRRQAGHDALTGLANRAVFQRSLAAVAGSSARALLLVDIDGFKVVNDNYGHGVGDACLVEVARRLRRLFREADQIARIGGDEFAVLVRGRRAVAELEGRARKVAEAIAEPMSVEGHVFQVSASVVIARADDGRDNAASAGDLFARADRAMHAAKAAARAPAGLELPSPAAQRVRRA